MGESNCSEIPLKIFMWIRSEAPDEDHQIVQNGRVELFRNSIKNIYVDKIWSTRRRSSELRGSDYHWSF